MGIKPVAVPRVAGGAEEGDGGTGRSEALQVERPVGIQREFGETWTMDEVAMKCSALSVTIKYCSWSTRQAAFSDATCIINHYSWFRLESANQNHSQALGVEAVEILRTKWGRAHVCLTKPITGQ